MSEGEANEAVAPRDQRPGWKPPAAWVTAGLENLVSAPGQSRQRMIVPDGLRDASNRVAPGALAVLSDSTLGRAVVSTLPEAYGMATSHLHLELLRPISRDLDALLCDGEQRAIDDRFALAEADITGPGDEMLAKVTIGAVLLEVRPHHERLTPAETARPQALPSQRLAEGSPVLAELGARLLSADSSGVRLHMTADPRFANNSRGVHGGFGALMGERTLDVALRAALEGEREMRPVELRAAFLRPIVADGAPIECHASVMHLGRRLAAARGEVRDHRGRPAVLVDATYIAV